MGGIQIAYRSQRGGAEDAAAASQMIDMFVSNDADHKVFNECWESCTEAQKTAIQACLPGIDVTDLTAVNDKWMDLDNPKAMKEQMIKAYMDAS